MVDCINPNGQVMIGNSPQMKMICDMILRVAVVNSTALILGETGTGKELVATAIHQNSLRCKKPMVKVNCATLPARLMESELFGHEKGAFTGAIARRVGKFELADGGTLFLDEIGEIPLELQAKLLRALQEREIERIGGKHTIKIDVRIVAATNRDLWVEMAEGRFRVDLFYRLNSFPIELPPLRDRKEDIPLLAAHFVNHFSKQLNKHKVMLGRKAMANLVNYPWPGNIRELEHLVERSVLMAVGPVINTVHLPLTKRTPGNHVEESVILKTIDENERDHIIKILRYCNGKVGGAHGAAKILDVPPTTLNSKMKRLGIKKKFNI